MVNRWLLAGKPARMIEGSEDASTEGSSTTEGDVDGSEERIKSNSSALELFLIVGGQAKSIFTSDPY